MMSTSFGHDIEHALPASSVADEYRQIDRLYGPRGKGWQFVSQALMMDPRGPLGGRRFDAITIRTGSGQERVIYFDITSFLGVWPDHAAGRILRGAEMDVKDITGAGQATQPSTASKYGPTLFFVGLALLSAYGLGRMAQYRPNPCGCVH